MRSLLFKAFLVTIAQVLLASPSFGFEMDVSPAGAARRTGEQLLADMPVGERARFSQVTLLVGRSEAGELFVSGFSRGKNDDEEYSGYLGFFEVEKLPDGNVAITTVRPRMDKDSKILYQSLSVAMPCDLLSNLAQFDINSLLAVDTIDGKTRLSELIPAN